MHLWLFRPPFKETLGILSVSGRLQIRSVPSALSLEVTNLTGTAKVVGSNLTGTCFFFFQNIPLKNFQVKHGFYAHISIAHIGKILIKIIVQVFHDDVFFRRFFAFIGFGL